jgi:hypothetical protein
MDWDLVIKRNSEALKGIVEMLFAMLGLGEFRRPSTAPCCGCSGPPNPPCAGLLLSRRGVLW